MAYTTAAMLHPGRGKRPALKDFVLRWGKRRRQTPEEMLSVFRALAASMNERENRGSNR